MTQSKEQAKREFLRMVKWIAFAAVLMVVGALAFLYGMDALSIHSVIATIFGVFFSVVLGCGLFALAFFSDKSGHDQNVSNATTRQKDDDA
jgi:preprotein translocase subunit SecY